MAAGPGMVLPHLPRAKAAAITARLRVPWHLQNGQQTEACDDWIAAFDLGRNVSRDGTLISFLVQIAIESINCSTVAANFGKFSPESLARLQSGIEAAPPRRTVAESLRTEKTLCQDWWLRKVLEAQRENSGNEAKAMEAIHQLLGTENPETGEPGLWPQIAQAAGGTSDGVVKLLRQRDELFEQVVALATLPYPEFGQQEAVAAKELAQSANPFVAASLPSLLRAREREFRIEATLALVRAAVEYRLHGEAAFKKIQDPCANGPIAFRRFILEGVDRGFELKSGFNLGKNLAVLIFVEKEGTPFQVDGNFPGRPLGARGSKP